MPHPRFIVNQPPGGTVQDSVPVHLKGQQRFCCCCGSFSSLKCAVDELALRHDQLMDRIDAHYQKLAEKIGQPFELQQLDIQSTAPARLSTGSFKTRRTRTKSEISEAPCNTSATNVNSSSKDSLVGSTLFDRWIKAPMRRWAAGEDLAEPVDSFVRTRKFEIFSGSVIFINMILLFVQLELQSCEASVSLGHFENACDWPRVGIMFRFAELAFNVWYLLELLMRVFTLRWQFLVDRLNLVDVVVVCAAFFQYAFAQVDFLGVAPLRFFRVLRALRVVRIIRLLAIFKELHILLKTLAASFYSFQWSICLLSAIIWSSGLLVMQLLDAYIQDHAQDLEIRESLYVNFGTPLRAGYSMFVAAFSSAWVSPARQMIEHVNSLFAVFWVLYIVMVNFMVIRVIAALFLKQTMDIASQDSERRAMEHQKKKEKFAFILRDLFARYDTSGDGKISKQEFNEMIHSKHVLQKFKTLGLDYEEVCALFDVMCSDDGVADYEELLTGAMLMNSSARTFDTIRIIHQLGALMRSVFAIERRLGIPDHRLERA